MQPVSIKPAARIANFAFSDDMMSSNLKSALAALILAPQTPRFR
jgi:hypothetical protein